MTKTYTFEFKPILLHNLSKTLIFGEKNFNFDQTYLNTGLGTQNGEYLKPRFDSYSIMISGKIKIAPCKKFTIKQDRNTSKLSVCFKNFSAASASNGSLSEW